MYSDSRYYSPHSEPQSGYVNSEGVRIMEHQANVSDPPIQKLDSQQDAQQEAQFEAQFLRHATAWIPQGPVMPAAHGQVLQRPVVIPRINIGNMLEVKFPFIRAYAPALTGFDIMEQDFINFVDILNIAQAPPAPLQVLNTAGMAIGFIPNHWAVIAGIAMNVAAGAGTAAISAVRTKSVLEKVNSEYFAPRGLKASIIKDKDLNEKVGYNGTLSEASSTPNEDAMTMGRRQVDALGPRIAHLTFDVPPPTEVTNSLDKMTRKQMDWRLRKLDKKTHKEAEKRAKLEAELREANMRDAEMENTYGYPSPPSYSNSMALGRQGAGRSDDYWGTVGQNMGYQNMGGRDDRIADRRERREQERSDRQNDKDMSKKERELEKLEKKRAKEGVKENKRIGKMEYIIIEMLPAEIQA